MRMKVTAKIAQTLDGKVATSRGESKWITSPATRRFTREQRADFDAILVGINTVIKDDPRLTSLNKNKPLFRIIIDSTLRLKLSAKVIGRGRGECVVATTRKASSAKIKRLEFLGIDVLICPLRNGRVHLKWLFDQLQARGIRKLLIEGGANIIGSALREALVDEMFIFVAPKILGDQSGLSSVVGHNPKLLNQALNLKEVQVKKLGSDIFIRGKVRK